jgi:hypothetical protein
MLRFAVLRRCSGIGLAAGLAIVAAGGIGTAQDASKIQGHLYIAGKTPSDPPLGEPKNTHAYVTMQGPGAMRIYRAMKAREQDDLCRGDGWKIKRAGHLACSASRKEGKVECDFAVELTRGSLAAGNPC